MYGLRISSNRRSIDSLIESSWNELSNRSAIDLLIGFGSGSSKKVLGNVAHNEWLEFLLNYGIIGIILYATLLMSLFWQLIKMIVLSSEYARPYIMALVYIVLVGMVGQIYFAHSTFYVFGFFGLVEGLIKNELKERNKNRSNNNSNFPRVRKP